MRAAPSRPCTSRTTARASTGPEHAPSACTKRAAISISMVGAKAQAMLAAKKRVTPASSTGRRPKRSESGP